MKITFCICGELDWIVFTAVGRSYVDDASALQESKSTRRLVPWKWKQ